jgi:hypothetical protein
LGQQQGRQSLIDMGAAWFGGGGTHVEFLTDS